MSILNVSQETLLSSLVKHNPWWEDQNYSFHLSKKRAYFKNFKNLVLNKNIQRAVILMGPRRVGKTVMLRQLIDDVLKQKQFSSYNIFFISVDDPIYSNVSLEEFISLFHKKTQHNIKTKKLVIFDEIQYLKDWERHLKVLIDKYPHIKFVASGSSAAALKRQSTESGAGRFTDFFLPPLTFKEFIDLSKKNKPNNIKKWNEEFINYINFGGYPEPIFNEEIRKNVRRFIGQDVVDKVLLRDLPNLYGIQDIQELNSLLTMVAFNSGLEINLESLSKKSNVTKNTIQKYLTYLESAFLIRRVYRIDDSCKRFQRERYFKVYLTNPSMYSALFGQVKETGDDISNIIETTVFSQYFHKDYSFGDQLYFARWKRLKRNNKDLEVDLVITNEQYKIKTLLEIKWRDRHLKQINDNLEGLLNLAVKHKLNKVLTTSRTTELYNSKRKAYDVIEHKYKGKNVTIVCVPCSVFCYYIGKIILQDGGINMNTIKSIEKDQ